VNIYRGLQSTLQYNEICLRMIENYWSLLLLVHVLFIDIMSRPFDQITTLQIVEYMSGGRLLLNLVGNMGWCVEMMERYFPSVCVDLIWAASCIFGLLVLLKSMTGPLSKQLLLPARLTPLGRGAFMLPFPPSIQFELYGLVAWALLLLGLCYLFLGRSPVQFSLL
jgi:hypothetical protein